MLGRIEVCEGHEEGVDGACHLVVLHHFCRDVLYLLLTVDGLHEALEQHRHDDVEGETLTIITKLMKKMIAAALESYTRTASFQLSKPVAMPSRVTNALEKDA